MKTCAVIVAAHQAGKWANHLIWSFRGQIPRPGWRYELRIGVDGCKPTRNALLNTGQGFWMSSKNVGAYIIRNSLIELEQADAYSIFDADDYMLPHFLTTLLAKVEEGKITGAGRVEFRGDGPRLYVFQGGILTIPHFAWERLGGFRKDRVSSDTDFIHRARDLNIPVSGCDEPLFVRRVHNNNTTRHPLIGLRTPYRARVREKHKTFRNTGQLHVEPVTTPLSYHQGELEK